MSRTLLFSIALAAGVYALLAFGASRSVYFPMKYPAGDWTAGARIGAQDVWIREGLHGWYIPVADSKIATLHLHGNAGNITHRSDVARHLREAGSSVLLLDYRGYGRSQGRPTEPGLYDDALRAYDWLAARHEHVILHGESLGTAVAAEIATKRRAAGVVLEAPFTSARAVAGKVLPFVGPLLIWGFNTKAKIARIRAPLLIVHGDRDEIIAYEFGQELYRAANEPKELWTVTGAMHNDLHEAGAGEWVSRLRAFHLTVRKFAEDHPQ